jgi:hypothetical protein
VVLQYARFSELPPPERGGLPPRWFEAVSLLPAAQLGPVGLAAGVHLGWSSGAVAEGPTLSGSLRPSVKVGRGLELAAEVAGRTAAADGGELGALRGEVGYRFQEGMLLAVGYTFLGYSGTGLPGGPDGQDGRLYLRAELSY